MKEFGIDVETFDPDLIISGPSWVHGKGKVLVTGVYDTSTKSATHLRDHGWAKVRSYLLSETTTLIGANIAYDIGWLCYAHGISMAQVKCSLIDILVAESFIDEYHAASLDSLAGKYLNERKEASKLPEICALHKMKGDFRKHINQLWNFPDSTLQEKYRKLIQRYVSADARQAAQVWERQKILLVDQGLLAVFEMNMKMLKVTCKMKERGVRIDYDKWLYNCSIVDPIHNKLEQIFFRRWGKVNIQSPNQLGELMMRHNVPFKWRITVRGWAPSTGRFVVKRDVFTGDAIWEQKRALGAVFSGVRVEKGRIRLYTDTAYKDRTVAQLIQLGYNVTCTPNIDKYMINEQKASYPVVADLAEYKQVKSIISKFLGPKFARFLVYHKSTDEWRLHCNFNVVGARQTGRLSSSVPNLQNIPSKVLLFEGTDHAVDLAVMCREIFLPEKGHIFVRLDFMGQENRLQAHFAVGKSGDRIRNLYKENPRVDEHQFVATISGLEIKYGKKAGRKYAKNVRFGISYGMFIARMCTQFGWEKEFAQELYDAICDAAPWVIDTMNAVQDKVAKVGYVRTILGRRMHLKQDERSKTYQFYNYIVQGSAADQTKACQVACDETESVERLLLSVHDEGDFSLPITDEGLARLKELQRIHETALSIDVPVICDPELGTDWAHLEGQWQWTEEDLKVGLCSKNQVGSPKESIDDFWHRMVAVVKSGKQAKSCTFDISDIADEDDEEDDDDDD